MISSKIGRTDFNAFRNIAEPIISIHKMLQGNSDVLDGLFGSLNRKCNKGQVYITYFHFLTCLNKKTEIKTKIINNLICLVIHCHVH